MFNENLRMLRKGAGLKQCELAKQLDVDQRTISAWEKDICEPDIDTLKRLKTIFDVTLDELLE